MVTGRWDLVEDATLRRHDFVQLRTESAPLVQKLEQRGGRPFTVNLTFLSSRPELARVLANSFWMVYQPEARSATTSRTANVLKLLDRFLNYRAQNQPDTRTAKDISADLLKEFAVWLVSEGRLKRKLAANAFTTCC